MFYGMWGSTLAVVAFLLYPVRRFMLRLSCFGHNLFVGDNDLKDMVPAFERRPPVLSRAFAHHIGLLMVQSYRDPFFPWSRDTWPQRLGVLAYRLTHKAGYRWYWACFISSYRSGQALHFSTDRNPFGRFGAWLRKSIDYMDKYDRALATNGSVVIKDWLHMTLPLWLQPMRLYACAECGAVHKLPKYLPSLIDYCGACDWQGLVPLIKRNRRGYLKKVDTSLLRKLACGCYVLPEKSIREFLSSFVGEFIIRTAPTSFQGGKNQDRGFMQDPVLVLDVTDSHLVCAPLYSFALHDEAKERYLAAPYYDKNWTLFVPYTPAKQREMDEFRDRYLTAMAQQVRDKLVRLAHQ